MTDYVYTEILKPFNQCQLTGVESLIYSERFNDNRINIYRDNYGQHRITIKNVLNDCVMSSILFDNKKIVRFKYTRPEHRGNNYTKQLMAYIEYKVKRKFYHSDSLTEAGAKSI